MNYKKHLKILAQYKKKYLHRHFRRYCRMHGLVGDRAEDLKKELISVINFKFVQGLERCARRCKHATTEKYVVAAIDGGVKDYFAKLMKWEIHRRPLSKASEPYYEPKDTLELSDFSFEGLTDNEIRLVIYRIYNFSYDYICDVLNISYSCARQLYSRGIKKMRKNKKNLALFKYLFKRRVA